MSPAGKWAQGDLLGRCILSCFEGFLGRGDGRLDDGQRVADDSEGQLDDSERLSDDSEGHSTMVSEPPTMVMYSSVVERHQRSVGRDQ